MTQNPFSDDALRLIQKRDRWNQLMAAKTWIEDWYVPAELELSLTHKAASGVRGYPDAMSVVREVMPVPSKEFLLAHIQCEFGKLRGCR